MRVICGKECTKSESVGGRSTERFSSPSVDPDSSDANEI